MAPFVIGLIPVLTAMPAWLGLNAHDVGEESALSSGPAPEAPIEPTDQVIPVMWIACAAESQTGTFSTMARIVMLAVLPMGMLRAPSLNGWNRATQPPINLTGDRLPVTLNSASSITRSTLSDGRVAQIVGIPPLAAITTGVQSASTFSQPD